MTNKHKYGLLLIMVLSCMVWASCTQERQPCMTLKTASLNIRCIHKQTDTALVFVDTALPVALLVAFTDSGETRFLYRSQATAFSLSLSSITDSCKWGITTDTLGRGMDTLTFYYKRNQQFISNACGYAYFYTLESVRTTTSELVDSVRILDNNVTNNVSATHLQVFIHPAF